VDYGRWARAAFQWGVIAAVVWRVRSARKGGEAVTRRLGLAGKAGRGLHSFQFQLNLSSSVHRITKIKS
jgi:hypothetical protein